MTGTQQLCANRQQCGTLPIGHEPEKPDADEPTGKRVQKEAPQELVGFQGHQFVLPAISVIFPSECDLIFGQGNQSVIGYGNTVGVVGQIFQYVVRAAE